MRLADERDESVSAWISEAARLQAANAELGALVDEYEAKHGVLTPDEVRAAQEPWPVVTSDPGDLHRLLDHLRVDATIIAI